MMLDVGALVLMLLAIASLVRSAQIPSQLPSLPDRYFVRFEFQLPQWKESGYKPVVEPVSLWFDAIDGAERIEFWDGLDVNVMKKSELDLIEGWMIYPQEDKLVCGRSYVDTLFGLASAWPSELDKFAFAGYVDNWKGHLKCEKWFRYVPKGGATNNFTFYVDANTRSPVSYTYAGDSGSLMGYQHSPNYDWFEVVYTDYKPNFYNSSAFVVPSICSESSMPLHAKAEVLQGGAPLGLEQLWRAFGGSKKQLGQDEQNSRKAIMRANLATIHKHNQIARIGKLNFTLAPNNRFIFATSEELATPSTRGFNRIPFLKARKEASADRFYAPISRSPAELPSYINWVERNAVTKMKDQGDCGSCWSFGSAAAVESAFFLKSGNLVPLSEQFLMDCSWGKGNNACFGGDHSTSYEYVISNHGVWPSESDYGVYRMNQNYCNKSTSMVPNLKLKTFKYVVGEHQLMDALANHGPVAVAMSTFPAAPFAFYHDGVFDDHFCNPLIPDHIVTAVGYGTDEKSGMPYWLLKNQWSHFWGIDGYMKIARAWDVCGVSTMGALPIVE